MKTLELSKRNLLTLLHKLQVPGSLATLDKPTPDGRVLVTAVADEVAYANRQPGPMSRDTEEFIEDVEEFLKVRQVRNEYQNKRAKKAGIFGILYGGGKV